MPRAKMLGRLQDLIGRAISAHADDRDLMSADKVVIALNEAFEIVVKLRSRYRR